MKTTAICSTSLKKIKPENSYFNISICGENFTIGILDNVEQPSHNQLIDDSILVKIKAFSCNYRDKSLILQFNQTCKIQSKDHKYFFSPFGSEFVAEVINVGKDVKKIKIGDRIIPDGSYPNKKNGGIGGIPTNYASQRMQCFKENQVVKIPDTMPDEVAASFTIASQTVYGMIRRLELNQKSNVLVTAATSNTSLAAIKVLCNRGINTYAISTNQNFEKQLYDLGIHQLIPYSTLEKRTIKEYINGVEFDAIIDPFIDIYLAQIINCMKFNGKYIYCGYYNQNSFFEQLKNKNNDYLKVFSHCLINNISIVGNCLGIEDDLQNAMDDYVNGKYDIIVDSIYTGNDIVPFIEKTFHDTPRFGKVVYKYDD